MADERVRDKRINFWLTESEHNDIQKKADEYGMSLSEYIRTVALYTDIHLDLSKVKSSKKIADTVEIKSLVKVAFSEDEVSIAEKRAEEFGLNLKSYFSALKTASIKKHSASDVLKVIDDILSKV